MLIITVISVWVCCTFFLMRKICGGNEEESEGSVSEKKVAPWVLPHVRSGALQVWFVAAEGWGWGIYV